MAARWGQAHLVVGLLLLLEPGRHRRLRRVHGPVLVVVLLVLSRVGLLGRLVGGGGKRLRHRQLRLLLPLLLAAACSPKAHSSPPYVSPPPPPYVSRQLSRPEASRRRAPGCGGARQALPSPP